MMAPKLLWKASSITMFLITCQYFQDDGPSQQADSTNMTNGGDAIPRHDGCTNMANEGDVFFAIILLDLIHKLNAFLLPTIFRWIYPA